MWIFSSGLDAFSTHNNNNEAEFCMQKNDFYD